MILSIKVDRERVVFKLKDVVAISLSDSPDLMSMSTQVTLSGLHEDLLFPASAYPVLVEAWIAYINESERMLPVKVVEFEYSWAERGESQDAVT